MRQNQEAYDRVENVDPIDQWLFDALIESKARVSHRAQRDWIKSVRAAVIALAIRHLSHGDIRQYFSLVRPLEEL